MRELTKDEAESICFKADMEGTDYALQEGYMDALKGTKYENVLVNAQNALADLETVIFELKDKFEIEDS